MLYINRNISFSVSKIAAALVLVNAGVWLVVSVLSFLLTPEQFVGLLQTVFEFPAKVSVFVKQPWTIVTYAFAQISFWHLFFNCMVIGFGASFLSSYFGSRRTLIVYLAGALFGALSFMIASLVVKGEGDGDFLIGSSASAMALVGALAVLLPEKRINILPGVAVRLLWICMALIGMDIILSVAPLNPARIAHVGGAFSGIMFALIFRLVSNRSGSGDVIPEEILRKARKSGINSLTTRERLRLFNLRDSRKSKSRAL